MNGALGIVQFVELAIIIAAVIGIGLVAVRVAGVVIPEWAVKIFWIVVVAVFAIGAINLLVRMVA